MLEEMYIFPPPTIIWQRCDGNTQFRTLGAEPMAKAQNVQLVCHSSTTVLMN